MSDHCSRAHPPLALAALGLVILLAVAAGARGIDLGLHWDEGTVWINASRARDEGLLLPRWYNYPSVSFWLALAAVPPPIAEAQPPGNAPLPPTPTGRFVRRVRLIFLAISLLAIPATFLLARALGRPPLEAALAAALLGTSWEFGYHARWTVPDAVLTAFGALTAWLVAEHLRRRGSRHALVPAAIAAGLACGTKYLGGILLFPLLAAAALRPPSRAERPQDGPSVGVRVAAAFRILLIFGTTYLVSTPGTLLEPWRFLESLAHERHHYQYGHPNHTVEAGAEHLQRIARYLGETFFSSARPLALCWTALALVGVVAALSGRVRGRWLLVGAPFVAHLLYMGEQRVFIPRNLLFVTPVMAVLAARGLGACLAPLRGRLRLVAGLLVAGAISWQAWDLARAAESVVHRGDVSVAARACEAYLSGLDAERSPWFASPGARRLLGEEGGPEQGARFVVALPHELVGEATSGTDAVRCSFGPREVNWRWYPNWPGSPRLLLLDRERARRYGLLPARWGGENEEEKGR